MHIHTYTWHLFLFLCLITIIGAPVNGTTVCNTLNAARFDTIQFNPHITDSLTDDHFVNSLPTDTNTVYKKLFDHLPFDASIKSFVKKFPDAFKKDSAIDLLESFYRATCQSFRQDSLSSSFRYNWYLNTMLQLFNNRKYRSHQLFFYEFTVDYESRIFPSINNTSFKTGDTLLAGINTYRLNSDTSISYTIELSRLITNKFLQPVKFSPYLKSSHTANRESWYTKVKLVEPGIYKVTIKCKNRFFCRLIKVGRIDGIAHHNNRNLLINAFSKDTQIVPPFNVLLKGPDTSFLAKTDKAGVCQLLLPSDSHSVEYTILLEKDGSYGVIPVRFTPRKHDEPVTTYLYPDRPWYRPGDTVHIGGIIKKFRNGDHFDNARIDSVYLQTESSFSQKSTFKTLPVDSFGLFTDSLVLPDNEYQTVNFISYLPGTHDSATSSVRVMDPKKPEYSVFVCSSKPKYYSSDTVEFTLTARSLSGIPMRYVPIDLEKVRKVFEFDTIVANPYDPVYKQNVSGETWYLGNEKLSFDRYGKCIYREPVSSLMSGIFEIQAEITGPDNQLYRVDASVVISNDQTPVLQVYTDNSFSYYYYNDSHNRTVSCFVIKPDGRPDTSTVTCTVYRKSSEPSTYSMKPDSRGIARFTINNAKNNCDSITCFLNRDSVKVSKTIFNLKNTDYSYDVDTRIVFDKDLYKVGDTAVISTYQPPSAHTLITIDAFSTLYYLPVITNQNIFTFKVPITHELGVTPSITHAYFDTVPWTSLQNENKTIPIDVDSSNLITAHCNIDRLAKPGSVIHAQLSLKDRDNKPSKARFSAAVVDDGVFKVMSSDDSGALKSLTPFIEVSSQLFESDEYFYYDIPMYFTIPSFYYKQGKRSLFKYGPSKTCTPLVKYGTFVRSNELFCDSFEIPGKLYGTGFGSCDDLYGNLMGGDGGGLALRKKGATRLSAPEFVHGGVLAPEPRTRFLDQAYWFHGIESDQNGNASFTFTLPDNLTKWDIRLLGADNKHYIIDYCDSILAQKDVTIQLYSPRFFTVHDSTIIRAVATNNLDSLVSATIHIHCMSKDSQVLSQLDTTIVISSQQSVEFECPLKIVSDIDTLITLASIRTSNENDAEQLSIPVLLPYIKKSSGVTILTTGNDTVTLPFMEQCSDSLVHLSVSIDNSPLLPIFNSLNYLIQYPYGCVEQTMSRFAPMMNLNAALKKQNVHHALLEEKIAKYAPIGVQKLQHMQHKDGGWGWWTTDTTSAEMTSLVTDCLFNIPDGMVDSLLQNTITAMRRKAVVCIDSLLKDSAIGTAEAINLLYAVSTSPEIVRYANLISALSDCTNLNIIQRCQLLQCAYNAKTDNVSKLLQSIEKELIHEKNICYVLPAKESRLTHWQSSPVYTTAFVLNTLVNINPDHPLINRIINYLMINFNGSKWESTITTGEVIKALSNYCDFTNKHTATPNSTLSLNAYQIPLTFSANEAHSLIPSAYFQHNNILTIGSQQKTLFTTLRLDYSYNILKKQEYDSSVTIDRNYFKIDFNRNKTHQMFYRFVTGDPVRVDLTVTTKKPMKFIQLTDYIPAGMEIDIKRSDRSLAHITHKEYARDRIHIYADSLGIGTHTVSYYLSTLHAGMYTALPPTVTPMYKESRSVTGKASIIRIDK
jgi:hypothetical protein